MRYKQKCTVGLLESSQLIREVILDSKDTGTPSGCGSKDLEKAWNPNNFMDLPIQNTDYLPPHPNFSYVTNKFLSCLSQCHLIFLFYVYVTKFNPNL